jgi:hypothetical protein
MKSPLISALLFAFALPLGLVAHAKQEGPVPTQVLVNVDPKSTPPASASALIVFVNDHKQPVSAWEPVIPTNAQVALLIDDGLLETVISPELDNLRSFVRTLPPGVEITVGYMHNDQVTALPFTTDHELAASKLRLPQGMAGLDSNPYICISNFVKSWPNSATPAATSSPRKARFILMLTDGVDPIYSNGQGDARAAKQAAEAASVAQTSQALQSQAARLQSQGQQSQVAQSQLASQQQSAQMQLLTQQTQAQGQQALLQESPFVKAAVEDAQRAGVAINEIYYSNGSRTGGLPFLSQITQGTGGTNYFEGGNGNPVSTAPFLQQFQRSIAQTYIATFNAPAINNPQHDLVRVKFTAAKTKLHAPEAVRPGNVE